MSDTAAGYCVSFKGQRAEGSVCGKWERQERNGKKECETSRSSFELDVCWQNVKRKRKEKKIKKAGNESEGKNVPIWK